MYTLAPNVCAPPCSKTLTAARQHMVDVVLLLITCAQDSMLTLLLTIHVLLRAAMVTTAWQRMATDVLSLAFHALDSKEWKDISDGRRQRVYMRDACRRERVFPGLGKPGDNYTLSIPGA
eukprot:scaffold231182_cov21-Tisochrysis_lutea.AAC.2